MKLLLDENLSRRIVPFLQTAFPDQLKLRYWAWKFVAISHHAAYMLPLCVCRHLSHRGRFR